MVIQSRYNLDITITTPGNEVQDGEDEYGNPTYVDETTVIRGIINQTSSNENEDDRNTLTFEYLMLCDADENITALTTVSWQDENDSTLTHSARVVGKPMIKYRRNFPSHMEVQLHEIHEGEY